MEKSLLVTISESMQSLMALRFVQGFFASGAELALTLFYVQPKTEVSGERSACLAAERSLAEAKKWLGEMGYPLDKVKTKLAKNKLGVVKDIVHEAEEGLYDAMVLGRRGMNWFDELFTDSVSHRILWEGFSCPVWVCRYPSVGRKNVLLCIDSSEECLYAADHAGFILRDEPRHNVTIFNMSPSGDCELEYVEQAMSILKANGIEESRINVGCAKGTNPAAAILEEAGTGKYAAVAIGRSAGKPEGVLGHIFGPTSLKLLRNLEGAALWISK